MAYLAVSEILAGELLAPGLNQGRAPETSAA
jgi:hypothetical protein